MITEIKNVPDETFSDTYVELTQENILDFAKFMQQPRSLLFSLSYGFPVKLNEISVRKNCKIDYSIVTEMNKIEKRRLFDHFHGQWVETDIKNIINLNTRYGGNLFNFLSPILPRRSLCLDERLVTYENFDKILHEFPIFDSQGKVIYGADIYQGKIFIPSEPQILTLSRAYSKKFSNLK